MYSFQCFRPNLCRFIENAIKFGTFPLSCKTIKTVPLFKSGDKDNLINYHPISILTCFSKNSEKLMNLRLFAFFQKHSFHVHSQKCRNMLLITNYAQMLQLTNSVFLKVVI